MSGQLVTLSDVSDAYFDTVMPASVDGVPVSHLAWSAVKADIAEARKAAGGAERVWLGELDSYLRRAVVETDPASGWALSVVLNDDLAGGTTFRNFVTDLGIYFHPFGGWAKGWPTTPPNFMAFRWGNKVHQIRRVAAAEPVPDLVSRWPDVTDEWAKLPHVIYTLGPPLRMTGPLPCGQNYRAAHVWALVDQLLVCSTLQEAIVESRRIAVRRPGLTAACRRPGQWTPAPLNPRTPPQQPYRQAKHTHPAVGDGVNAVLRDWGTCSAMTISLAAPLRSCSPCTARS